MNAVVTAVCGLFLPYLCLGFGVQSLGFEAFDLDFGVII